MVVCRSGRRPEVTRGRVPTQRKGRGTLGLPTPHEGKFSGQPASLGSRLLAYHPLVVDALIAVRQHGPAPPQAPTPGATGH